MLLRNDFHVPLPPEQACQTLLDVKRIAPCMPGATLTEIVDENTYKGEVPVRLRPVGLTVSGTATFQSIDHGQRVAAVKAQGFDSKGRGGADAVVSLGLALVDGGTRVEIETDLNLSGAVAQYGRGAGMIKSMAEQLIGRFAENLRAGIESAEVAEEAAEENSVSVKPVPATASKPILGFSLIFTAFKSWIAGIFISERQSS